MWRRGSSAFASGRPTASSSTFPSVSFRQYRVALLAVFVRELAHPVVKLIETARLGEQALECRDMLVVQRNRDQERVVRLGRDKRRIERAQPVEFAFLLLCHLLRREL